MAENKRKFVLEITELLTVGELATALQRYRSEHQQRPEQPGKW